MSARLAGIEATAVAPHIYWIASRAAGSAALLLSSVSVCLGLSGSMRLLKGRASDLRVAHEALSLATIVALVVHVLTLLGDGFLKPSIGELTVPFLSGYETLWTTIGIVAFWAMLALGLSYYVRGRIGVQRWRMLHRFSGLAWVLGLAHSLGEGTDAGQAWFLAMTAIAVLPALALLVARWARASTAAPAVASPAAAGPRRIGAAR
ncbi:MAG TPA: ferric reductase-like transmembrane domain-containing protein [Solirubrobacteraceae bacterium]|jgi:sulfoxide reductase heme-binding subunit YedZ|nr:ferric reductase-like transmembrane domain-containing protein [Solirubrobacteraceae bacterium]